MAVAFGSAGAVADSLSATAVAYPASISAGDLLVLHIANKYDPNGPSTPSGWTLRKQQSGGAGSSAADSGVMFATVFTKEADGSESGSLSVTVTSANVWQGVMLRYTKAGGTTWGIAADGGGQNSGTSSWSVTAGADPGLTAGDVVLACMGVNGNLVISPTSQAMTATGISAWGTMTERVDTATGTGNDQAIALSEHPVTTGTSSAAPVFTCTISTGGSPNANHPAGPVVFLRIREVAGSGSTGTSATTNANDTPSAAGTTTVTGTLARTNANDTPSAAGTTTIVGSSASTNANDSPSAAGTTTVVGSSATTNANDTSAASGSVGSGGSSGTAATTNANDTASAAGTTTVVGSSASTNANDTATASGVAGIVSGTSATTNANDVATAIGDAGAPARPRSGGGKNYIIKGRKYYNLTNQELAYLLARDLIDTTREDVRVTYKNKKKPVSKGVWESLQATIKQVEAMPPFDDYDDDEESAAMLLL